MNYYFFIPHHLILFVLQTMFDHLDGIIFILKIFDYLHLILYAWILLLLTSAAYPRRNYGIICCILGISIVGILRHSWNLKMFLNRNIGHEYIYDLVLEYLLNSMNMDPLNLLLFVIFQLIINRLARRKISIQSLLCLLYHLGFHHLAHLVLFFLSDTLQTGIYGCFSSFSG